MFDLFIVKTFMPNSFIKTIVNIMGLRDYVQYDAKHKVGSEEILGNMLEFICDREALDDTVKVLKNLHPDRVPYIQVIPMISYTNFSSLPIDE